MNMNPTGMIADIQRCSVHDGPGIRTTVFLKGCNLKCAWCHNPETVNPEPEFILNPDKCINCGLCDEGCYSGARTLCGKRMSVPDVIEEILLDQPYYGEEGGLTISGGEPLLQKEFVQALLAEVRKKGIKGAIETNMTFPWQHIEPVVTSCDLVMADFKIWDAEKHKKWTGLGNDRIKENLRRLSESGVSLILRTPLVPGVNNSHEEIKAIADFAGKLKNLLYYELLPYHPLGQSKSLEEGAFQPQKFETPGSEEINMLTETAKSCGIKVRVAGVIQ